MPKLKKLEYRLVGQPDGSWHIHQEIDGQWRFQEPVSDLASGLWWLWYADAVTIIGA